MPGIEERRNADNQIERLCEECSQWLPLYDYSPKGRAYVCAVCEGLRPPRKQRAARPDVGYQDYLDGLAEISAELRNLRQKYTADKIVLEQRKSQMVQDYYNRLKELRGKGNG